MLLHALPYTLLKCEFMRYDTKLDYPLAASVVDTTKVNEFAIKRTWLGF